MGQDSSGPPMPSMCKYYLVRDDAGRIYIHEFPAGYDVTGTLGWNVVASVDGDTPAGKLCAFIRQLDRFYEPHVACVSVISPSSRAEQTSLVRGLEELLAIVVERTEAVSTQG